MPIVKAAVADPTNFIVADVAGINYVTVLGNGDLLASLSSDGVVRSTDKGATWGSAVGTAQGGPFGTIFEAPLAVGAAPAGRLHALPLIVGSPSDKIYFSDDGGVTWTQKTQPDAGPSRTMLRGEQIIQTVGAVKALLTQRESSVGTGYPLWRSTDGGATWSRITVLDSALTRGIGLILRNSGAIEGVASFSTGSQTLARSISTDEGVTWSTPGATPFTVSSGFTTSGTRVGYHPGDDVIGIAIMDNVSFTFITINPVGTFTEVLTVHPDFGFGAPPNVIGMNWVMGLPGTPGGWVIAFEVDDGFSYWYRSLDGGVSFSFYKKFQISLTGEGILSNLVEVV